MNLVSIYIYINREEQEFMREQQEFNNFLNYLEEGNFISEQQVINHVPQSEIDSWTRRIPEPSFFVDGFSSSNTIRDQKRR